MLNKLYNENIIDFENTIDYIKEGGSPHLWALTKLENIKNYFNKILQNFNYLTQQNNILIQENEKLNNYINKCNKLLGSATNILVVYNLNENISCDDIIELFSVIGPIKSYRITLYKSNDIVKKRANITFMNNNDTFKAIKEYYDIKLDNETIKMNIVYVINQKNPHFLKLDL